MRKKFRKPKDSPQSDSVSTRSAAVPKHKMSYSLKAIATLLLIINAVNLISCASINYVDPERLQCVLVFSTEDKTFKRCRYADFTLAFCDGDELFEAKNCFRNPGFDSECLICSTVHKIGVVTESKFFFFITKLALK